MIVLWHFFIVVRRLLFVYCVSLFVFLVVTCKWPGCINYAN